jgi:hypothetical protein
MVMLRVRTMFRSGKGRLDESLTFGSFEKCDIRRIHVGQRSYEHVIEGKTNTSLQHITTTTPLNGSLNAVLLDAVSSNVIKGI